MEHTFLRQDCPEAGDDYECKLFLNYFNFKMFIDGEGRLQTDLYRKPCMKCQYLSPDSAHPRHVFKNIPKSLVHRIVRIVSVPGMREVRLEELGKMLLGRGYKAGDIRQAIEFGERMNREETLEKVVREDKKNRGRVRYTITFDPKLPHLPAILSKNWNVMVDSTKPSWLHTWLV